MKEIVIGLIAIGFTRRNVINDNNIFNRIKARRSNRKKYR